MRTRADGLDRYTGWPPDWAGRFALALTLLLVSKAVPLPGTQTPSPPGGAVQLAGGTFVMGTDATRIDNLLTRFQTTRREFFLAEGPAHRVTVRPFFIDRTETTNAEFLRFIEQHPEWAPGRLEATQHNGDYLKSWIDGRPPAGADDLPVTLVTWWAAVAYCEAAGSRLPTEAEWEFAARGGQDGEFPWGDQAPDPARANWSGTGLGVPTRVGRFPPNPYGLHDMAGNVWEFIQELWTDNYDVSAKTSSTAEQAGAGASPPVRRVIRGGSFGASAINLRVRYRDSHPELAAGPHVGFRCARSDPS